MVKESTTLPGHYKIDIEQNPNCKIIVFNEKDYFEKDYDFTYPLTPEKIADIKNSDIWMNDIEPSPHYISKPMVYKPYEECIKWLHIKNYKNSALLDKLKEEYDIHSLTLEDIVRGGQRSKHECFENYDAIFMQIISIVDNANRSQISILFNENTVITFGDDDATTNSIISSLSKRLKENKGRARKKMADYLTYCIADGVVDSYFEIIEELELRVEKTDESMVDDPSSQILQNIHTLKKDMLYMKKAVWPLREMATSMQRGESKFIKEETFVYVRDLYDHTVRIVETTEGLRDVTYSLIDLYMSANGMKMNQAMKVLTVISTIFVPITFLTSVYGMNFDGIKELHMPHAYETMWGIMITIAIVLLVWFKNKKWL